MGTNPAVFLPDKLFVFQPPFAILNRQLEPLVVFNLPGFIPGRKFIAISLQVLCADLVKDADNTAFQQAPKVFDSVLMKQPLTYCPTP
jgi:hypothetical protein